MATLGYRCIVWQKLVDLLLTNMDKGVYSYALSH